MTHTICRINEAVTSFRAKNPSNGLRAAISPLYDGIEGADRVRARTHTDKMKGIDEIKDALNDLSDEDLEEVAGYIGDLQSARESDA